MVASCHVDHFGIPFKCCDKKIRYIMIYTSFDATIYN